MVAEDQPDALVRALRRGEQRKAKLLKRAGGLWTGEQVATHLGISLEMVEERKQNGSLLAVEYDGHYGYPACQFTNDGVLPGLSEILQAMSAESGWTKLALLYTTVLQGQAARDGKSILEAVRSGHHEAALHAASTWGQHGAT